jgi:DNA-3-methyladenine glycosylase
MGIDRALYGASLLGETLWIEKPADYRTVRIARGTRIGVDYAGIWAAKPWRFFDRDSPYVSTVTAAARRKALRADAEAKMKANRPATEPARS